MEIRSVDQMLAQATEVVVTELCSEQLAAVKERWERFRARYARQDDGDLTKFPAYVVEGQQCVAEVIAIVRMDQALAGNWPTSR
jgi:hypothetical protein